MNHIEPRAPLEVLDPGESDPGYWTRFQSQVLASVGPALATRRGRGLTLGDAVLSWSRYFVPLAVTAAACAMFFLMRHPETDLPASTGVEDVLVGLQQDGEAVLPAFFLTEEVLDRDHVLLAVEGF